MIELLAVTALAEPTVGGSALSPHFFTEVTERPCVDVIFLEVPPCERGDRWHRDAPAGERRLNQDADDASTPDLARNPGRDRRPTAGAFR